MNIIDCFAYVGPGAGLSMIGAPILYPIRLFRRWAKGRNSVPAAKK
jgi:hypothetical protein